MSSPQHDDGSLLLIRPLGASLGHHALKDLHSIFKFQLASEGSVTEQLRVESVGYVQPP